MITREVFAVQVKKEEPRCTSVMYPGFFLEGSEKEEKGFIYTFSPYAIHHVEFIFVNNRKIISAPWVV